MRLFVRFPVGIAFGIALAAAGCFKPSVKNGGFACDDNNPWCPVGFYCVNGVCVTNPNRPLPPGGGMRDFSVDPGHSDEKDMSQPPTSTGGDMASSTVEDMAQPPPPPDMVTVNTCAHDKCKRGPGLDPSCDPCVKKICSGDSYCCDVAWDVFCVNYVSNVCGQSCP